MGTPDFAVPTLAAIVAAGHQVCAAYTRAPRPAGRGLELRPSPVEREARRLGIAVATPLTLRDGKVQDAFRAHRADTAIVVAYGLILPPAILEALRLGAFNLHASALPRWRGAAPINRAIMAGDPETAVAVMKMAEGLDTGPVARMDRVAIGPDMTAGELHDILAGRGARLMVEALRALEHGELRLAPQSETGITYAAKIAPDETRIDWAKPWQQVHDHCRGLSPFPGAWSALREAHPGAPARAEGGGAEGAGIRLKVLRTKRGEGTGPPGTVLDGDLTIACGEGAVRILELQRAGRGPMIAAEFLRGTRIAAGTRLA